MYKHVDLLILQSTGETLLNCRTSWMLWCAYPCLISIQTVISSTCYVLRFLHNGFHYCSVHRCYYLVCLTWARRIRNRINRICTLGAMTDMHHHTDLSFSGKIQWVLSFTIKKTTTEGCFYLCILKMELPSLY